MTFIRIFRWPFNTWTKTKYTTKTITKSKEEFNDIKIFKFQILPIIHTTIKKWIIHWITHRKKVWGEINIGCTRPLRNRCIDWKKNEIKLLRKPDIEKRKRIQVCFFGMETVCLFFYQQIPKINTTAISILTTFRFDWIESRCRFVTSPIAKVWILQIISFSFSLLKSTNQFVPKVQWLFLYM